MEAIVTITAVRVLKKHRLKLTFSDGEMGIVDLSDDIEQQGGDFAALADPDFFRLVRVNPDLGTIQWPNDVDYCPNLLREMSSVQPKHRRRRAPAA